MRIAIPHKLDKAEVHRRLHSRTGEIVDFIPGGLAQIESDWIADDHLALGITAMGQFIPCDVHIEDSQMVVEIDLPKQLSFVAGMIEKGVKQTGMKMLT